MTANPRCNAALAASALQTAEALGLDCVVFDVAPGVRPSGRPPVRIFVGSEEAQQRAERVLLFSVRKFRDPARVYQVYLMRDLPGFDRRDWRTGFTHYRFAIPELAGGAGRAIYNDVDQIYLGDPAELFDLDLGGHGYLALSRNDTAVMLIDCARMLPWWQLQTAQGRSKRDLVQAPAAEPGLWGALAPAWHARDLEYRPDATKLLHYTTLHLQPWRPAPDQYSYHPHPLGGIWLELEREADAADYQPFTLTRPSNGYRRLLAERRVRRAPADRDIDRLLAALGPARTLLCTLDEPPAAAERCFDPALQAQWPATPAEAVLAAGLLEHAPSVDVPWLLAALFARAERVVHLRIDLRRATAPADRPPPPRLAQPADWWRDQLAAAHRPGIGWQLELIAADGTRRRYRCAERPPRVWVLLGRHAGDNAQLLALAEALGWPYQTRQLVFKGRPILPTWLQGASRWRLDRRRSDALAPPWPELVLACGRRSVPIARWLRRQSGGRARLVHLGRPRAPLAAFDLVITTPQYQLPARPNVLPNVLPLNRALRPDATVERWRQRLAGLPRPWIAVLIGGHSGPWRLTAHVAAQLRAAVEARARSAGGSLLIATSPRTPAAAADLLLAGSDVPGERYRWRAGDPDNPYPAFLALADEFVVTGDSASMLADACAQGRPVHYLPLPLAPWHPLTPLHRLSARLRARQGERGTPRQQDAVGRRLDALIAHGLLRPPRDLGRLHEALHRSGLAQPLDHPAQPGPSPASTPSELQRTAEAVRRLLRRGEELPS